MTLFGILLLHSGETEAQRARDVCGQQAVQDLTPASICPMPSLDAGKFRLDPGLLLITG